MSDEQMSHKKEKPELTNKYRDNLKVDGLRAPLPLPRPPPLPLSHSLSLSLSLSHPLSLPLSFPRLTHSLRRLSPRGEASFVLMPRLPQALDHRRPTAC